MKIRTKLIITMIPLVSFSILILSYVGFQNFVTAIQTQLINELKTMASHTMNNLSHQMFERIADVQFLSTSNILVNSNLTISEKMDYLRSLEKSFKTYLSISLYNKEGIKIGDTRNILLGKNESQKTFFNEAVKGKMYYDTIPTLSESLNQYVIHFAAPLYNESKEIEGVVVTRQAINKINDIFKEIEFPDEQLDSEGSSLKLDLISGNGTVIYSNHDRSSILQIMPGFHELISRNDQQNNMSILNPSSAETRIDADEIIVSVPQGDGHLDYKGSGWFLLLRENTDVVFGNLQKTVDQFLIISGIILVISIILILFIARTISLPITKLMKKVIEVGKGNYDSRIDIKSSDEVGQLASHFDSMRQSVNQVNQTLNKRVMERTLELEKANEELKLNDEYLGKINKELVSADKAKEEFMSMVSHELKTPLVPAKGYVELLLKQKKTGELNEKQKKYASIVYRNIIKLEVLVNDVLDGYKIDMGRLKIQKNLVNVTDLISSVVSDLPSLIGEKQIIIKLDSKIKEETAIMCDQRRIEQVFANLIKNSIDFVPEGNGKITISAELIQNETMVQFSIEDNGTGIPVDKMNKLFHKFYQIDTSLIRKHGGSGLGLAISKGIVEAHGGKIWIDKEYRDGAAFRFTIPF
ncbi:ATP-binding protein [Candidatus Nitrosocosmicus arcticus]|uniref:histidine kinase n=1 Tax=Candidatus Nitrosocosmicus arcticus TaxID=2035267 RepID=A0A557SWT9_9ARCH|nr:ATP-binding protein [Candidatus Nitrosocosmicus arcticus]TVP41051.1 putative Signal transduction histidine kinase [Candidatus Nitrosocosmicus arcticus]